MSEVILDASEGAAIPIIAVSDQEAEAVLQGLEGSSAPASR